jgi:3' terminal RNA ribose 2'-O-methyltransferase Hen1
MLIKISTSRNPATDLSILLHKSAQRCQTTPLSFGKAHVFYPVASETQCTAVLLLDIDPIEVIRTKGRSSDVPLEQYVNDRPYVASSFLSVALAQSFGAALNGRCKFRPELVEDVFPLRTEIHVVLARGGAEIIERLFSPLGYKIEIQNYPLDVQFPEWGESNIYTVVLENNLKLKELLSHLYVLISVLDNKKHYFVGEEEMEKLLKHGEGWLAQHPEKELISTRFLKFQRSLAKLAIERLSEGEEIEEQETHKKTFEEEIEESKNLNEERHGTVLSALKNHHVESVIDIGCAEGRFLRLLLNERQFKRITGMDVSIRALEIASKRLRLNELPQMQKERIKLMHGSLMYRDKRLSGFDAATVIEVIEHMEPYRLAHFERVLFEFAAPRLIVITTPNAEYNVLWKSLPAGKFRHPDHRFEWSRLQFQEWANQMAAKYRYNVNFFPIGQVDAVHGSPTQMGIFKKEL